MTKFYCKLCGQSFTTPSGATTKRHINSKKHQKALEDKVKPKIEHELILYNAINKLNNPTYPNILKFFASFGIKAEITLKTIFKKLRDKDIIYKGNFAPEYEKVLQILSNLENFNYPMTFTIQETLEKFKALNFKYAPELIQFFNGLSHKFPE